MTNPMLAELDEVVRLSEKATPGPWVANDGELATDLYWAGGGMVADALAEFADGLSDPPNAQFVAAAVNFLRTHHATLADMAKRLEAAERVLEIRQHELAHERAVRDRLLQHLTSIHALLYPAPIEVDGKVCVFRPRLIDPHELMQELSDRIRAIPAAIAATQEGAG